MVQLQKTGGIAALAEALAYIVGFVAMATVLNPGNTDGWAAAQKLTFVLERKNLFQLWMLFIYVVAGGLLVVLAVALHDRFKALSVALMQVTTAFGLIWAGLLLGSGMVAIVGLDAVAALHARDAAQAAMVWQAVGVVQNGLGGGIEIVGGIWMLLLSIVAYGTGALPRGLIWLGLGIGAAGILTALPMLADLVVLFGLGQIAWFAWLGALMMRQAPAR